MSCLETSSTYIYLLENQTKDNLRFHIKDVDSFYRTDETSLISWFQGSQWTPSQLPSLCFEDLKRKSLLFFVRKGHNLRGMDRNLNTPRLGLWKRQSFEWFCHRRISRGWNRPLYPSQQLDTHLWFGRRVFDLVLPQLVSRIRCRVSGEREGLELRKLVVQ